MREKVYGGGFWLLMESLFISQPVDMANIFCIDIVSYIYIYVQYRMTCELSYLDIRHFDVF